MSTHQRSPHISHVSKAVIPAAGLGTRFLPASKATPKEMLPIVDKPAIEYVVEEAVAAGLTDVLMVTGRNKRALEDHFDRNYELEELLGRRGDDELLEKVRASSRLAMMHYVRQGDPKGLGHAVLCAEPHVGDQPFAVLLGDDLIDPRDPLLPRMAEVQQRYGGSVVALMEVEPALIHLYGCADIVPVAGEDGDIVRVTGLVEKPETGQAPSSYAVIGRYVLSPEIFPALAKTRPDQRGEIQLTDALGELAQRQNDGGPVHGVVFSGRRYDTGDRGAYLRATVRLACERADLGPAFRAWLKEFAATELA
ncbi:UTP--glucose-1-phosphate uridylyltransferase [Actinacidiphila paucisporea]|uniref:UTP--glucose-1-phosphate uridylyltransferase n=1 Tax=Actinacidiphila paucisporea TaxID=310782 RepID=A0A1M7QEU2_9ACTN|nr:UTP--glucose-1-phosphate uridylyltransferase [Actinacidiphila paucisporea]SHN29241.1 UDP-glucose pyrophosphorylase [Actinacidiphila paucisporea]